MEAWREVAAWVFASLVLWLGAYNGQRSIGAVQRASWPSLFITVPGWISALCGRPQPGNRVELGRMVGQLGAWVLSILWIPLKLAQVEYSTRMQILAIGFIINLVVSFIISLIGGKLRSRPPQ